MLKSKSVAPGKKAPERRFKKMKERKRKSALQPASKPFIEITVQEVDKSQEEAADSLSDEGDNPFLAPPKPL